MIVLDTNVISEALRPRPTAKVIDWLDAEPAGALFTTAITEAELLYGVALLPRERRKDALEAVVLRILADRFSGRILSFDSAAAREFADIVAARRKAGRPIGEADARIAAIARSRAATLATRGDAGFADCGIALVDPWT